VSPDTASCRFPGGSTGFDTVTVAVPEPENESGRLLLRLSGETLIRVDCEGRTLPSLANSWTREASGTRWTFELDSTLTSDSLVAQWELRRNGGFWPWNRILEVRAPTPRRLEVRLDSSFASVPQAFSIPQLVVVPSQIADSVVIRVRVHPSATDQRDLLDRLPGGGRGADLVITRDRATLSYAGNTSGFTLIPLAWDRTYVVLGQELSARLGSHLDALKLSLVREVVRAETRVAEAPFWWESSSCAPSTPATPSGHRAEIIYRQGDETAREIAERLVAMQRSPIRAVGLGSDSFSASLAAGDAVMYVLSLWRTAPGSCREKPAWPSRFSVVPLVDSRAHAIVREGVPGFTIEGDGTIRFDNVLRLITSSGSGR
jgi:hypothetical protein